MGEGVDREDLPDVVFFRGAGAEKLAACGHVAEEVADLDERAGRTADGADFRERAGVHLNRRALVRVGAPGCEREAGDGGDGGNGFAAEAECVNFLDVADVADFGGRLALEREDGVVLRHAAAVVLHGDELASALGDGDGDLLRASVDGVFDEFLDNGGRAFDDLARGDLVRHVKREDPHVSVSVRNQG